MRITTAEVAAIRTRYEAGEPLDDIATDYPDKPFRSVREAATGLIKGQPDRPALRARKPACMDAADFAAWQRLNMALNTVDQLDSPCGDCMPDHALEVRADPDRECDGHPLGVEEDRTTWTRADHAARAREVQRVRMEKRRAEARALRATGMMVKDVAAAVGVSIPSVYGYLRDDAA